MESTQAAKYIANQSLDMIFIDADHDYESVLKDIKAWVPKVKDGGCISGHDYDPTGGFDVWKVVHKVFGKTNFNIVPDDAGGPNNHCWWLWKNVYVSEEGGHNIKKVKYEKQRRQSE
jgi:hypothetical protein